MHQVAIHWQTLVVCFADNLRSTSSCHPLYSNSYSTRLCNDKFADKVSLADTIDSRCDSPIE